MESLELCSVEDIPDGSVKEFSVSGGPKVLLYNNNGEFFANSALCTHYHAPLVSGSLNECRIRCPWHGACFNLKTGAIEDFPGWEPLRHFQTAIRNGKVFICLDNSPAFSPASVYITDSERPFIVIGGGPAGFTAVQTLRENGFTGRLILISNERLLPYYRVKLSKQPAIDPLQVTLKPRDYYRTNNIEVILEKSVTSVCFPKGEVEFSDGTCLSYSHLIIATGSLPRRPNNIPPNIKGIHYLRTSEDGHAFANEAKSRNLIVIGGGFLSFEIAASFSKQASHVTVLSNQSVPVKRLFGETVGSVLLEMHKAAGVTYISDTDIKQFICDDTGQLNAIFLADGRTIPADCCLVAVGSDPTTAFLQNSGLEIDEQGFVIVDEFMATNLKSVFAAGDIADFPLPLSLTGGKRQRDHFGQWPIAQMTGRIAALNAIGKRVAFNTIPFIWGTMYGTNIRFAGYHTATSIENVIVHGDLDARRFIAYYLENSEATARVVAVATMGMDPLAAHFCELLTNGGQLCRKEIEEDTSGAWAKKYRIQ